MYWFAHPSISSHILITYCVIVFKIITKQILLQEIYIWTFTYKYIQGYIILVCMLVYSTHFQSDYLEKGSSSLILIIIYPM